jgi:hypothetical protein
MSMTATRYRYAATGFPMDYYDFKCRVWPLVCWLYLAAKRGK